MKHICLIPAKGSSTRLKNKNILEIQGKALLAHVIDKAKSAGMFDVICVSTEDEKISSVAKECGAEVPFLRPTYLSNDPATIVDVSLHAIEYYESKNILFDDLTILLPTSPLLHFTDIRKAHDHFSSNKACNLISVSKTAQNPFNSQVLSEDGLYLSPCFPDSRYKYTKSTECPETYNSNGLISIVKIEFLKNKRSLYAGKPLAFITPQSRSIDIDTEYDYLLAKLLIENERIFDNSDC